MKRRLFSRPAIAFAACALALTTILASCHRSIGHSVLLWDIPQNNLQDGQIVKVYFKSNISHVYVIGLPGSKENLEVPLWQLTQPVSKKKALKAAQKYAEYQHKYAKIKIDGLPVRADPVNTSKQKYRLHKDEVVKILYKGKGQDVIMHSGEKLEGDWLCVLTTGGTQGWCFSHNLLIFETGEGGKIVGGQIEEAPAEDEDAILNQVLQAKWRPESYQRMLEENTIDLESMKSSYGFDTGVESGKVSININGRYRTANYSGITKVRDKVYDFNGTPFQMIIRDANQIVVNYTGNDNKPEAYTFVTISSDYDIDELIKAEGERRAEEMQKLYKVDSFRSANYGTLTFTGNGTFNWNNYSLLVPNVISENAKGKGKVSIKYLVGKNLQSRFDGMLTFVFDNTSNEVNFFYKNSTNGLTLEDASDATIKNNVAQSQSKSPIVIFFSR